MNRAVAIAGLFAAGVAGLKGQNVTGLSQQERTKIWTLSGSLRGFYDDNSLNAPEGQEESSLGTEVGFGMGVNLPLERTLLRSQYQLILNWYEARTEHNIDQDHQFNFKLNHKFTPRRTGDLDNTFVYSDSPEVAAQEGTFSQRQDLSALRNRLALSYNHRFTPVYGATVGYRNHFQDYKEDGVGSLSSLLDQVEHLFQMDGEWYPNPHTTLLVGYQFGLIQHTSSDPMGFIGTPEQLDPERRDNAAHYFYVGGRRQFSRKLEGSARVGTRYTDYFNEGSSDFSPDVDISGTYTYLPASRVSLGLTVARSASDTGPDNVTGDVTLDSLMTDVHASINHRITPRIMGAMGVRYQTYTYNGGSLDGQTDDYFNFDLNLEYKIRENLFANTGYVWYRLLSNRENTSFSRNRVYAGVRAVF